MAYDPEIMDFVAARWSTAFPSSPPVSEHVGRGIALPYKIGEHPDQFTSMYIRKIGSSWIIEAGSAGFSQWSREAARLVEELRVAGY